MIKLKEFSCPIKHLDGSFALSDLDKANLFREHLSNIFIPHPDIIPSNTQLVKISNYLNTSLPMSLPIKHVSPNEIANVI